MPHQQLLTMLSHPVFAWAMEALGLGLLLGYQAYLTSIYRSQPELTYRGYSNRLRQVWVEVVRARDDVLLAIHTLRNWMTAATLFASTAILMAMVTLWLAFDGQVPGGLSHTLSLAPTGPDLFRVKLLLVSGFFFTAFLHFALSLRYYNHAGFLIRLPAERLGETANQGIADTLNRAGGHYHRGTRVFLLVVPFLAWLIGPDWFLGGALVSLVLLYRFDFRGDDLVRIPSPVAGGDFDVGDPHALLAEDVLAALHSQREGLSSAEAARRLAVVGPNRLPVTPRDGPLKRFFKHFHDILIYILLGAAVATAAMGYWVDTWVILAVAVINATIGFLQEGKAEEALEGIRKMLSAHARALRNGSWMEVDAQTLVPGDLVRLGPGARVPADLRLLETANLRIEESALTGEALAAAKDAQPVADEAGIGDRRSMAYSGTLVTGGQGLGVVTGTGATTEIGRINRMIAEVESLDTPLTRQMTAFGRVLSLVILGVAAVMFLVGWLLHAFGLGELFMAAIGFAVAAIPAGLPAIMTVTLALGVQRMVARNAITRKLSAVETLGSVTVICSDKTGTLTKNEMTVRHVVTRAAGYAVAGIGYAPEGHVSRDQHRVQLADHPDLAAVVEVMGLCNDAQVQEDQGHWRLVGEPTEGALRTLALKAGLDTAGFERLAVVPFDSATKLMATLDLAPDGRRLIHLKGAPDRLLDRCSTQRGANGADEPLDRDFWDAQIAALSAQGLRVLASARGEANADQATLTAADLDGGMSFLGLVGIVDPPRPEAITAIAACRRAGIRVKMITGDHAGTAVAIGREMGITETDHAVTGAELEAASDEDLRPLVAQYDIFARTSPEHKLRLVQALQANGEVVSMTGDGVNDAPALKRADVGVAMGIKGTEATKEAAEVVLADDNFASIARAVEEGRTIYDNLQKSILFTIPTNAAQALVILAAILAGFALPLYPVQILWVNMVTAVTLSLALAFEPAEPGLMQRPPRRPGAPILGIEFLGRVALVSLLIGAATIAVFLFEQARGYSYEAAQTMAVNTLVIGQLFYLLNSRYLRASSLRLALWVTNPVIWMAAGLLVMLQILFVYAPFMNTWFHSAPLTPGDWLLPIGIGLGIFLMVEAEKAVARRFGVKAGKVTSGEADKS